MKDRCREKVTGETKREQDGGGVICTYRINVIHQHIGENGLGKKSTHICSKKTFEFLGLEDAALKRVSGEKIKHL